MARRCSLLQPSLGSTDHPLLASESAQRAPPALGALAGLAFRVRRALYNHHLIGLQPVLWLEPIIRVVVEGAEKLLVPSETQPGASDR
jgi:hypothetical protein